MTSTTQSPTGAPLRSDLVTAIDHVGVAVPDLDVAIAWYTEHLGMVATHEEVNEEQGVREAMLSFPGATSASAALQLLAPLNEESTIAKFIGRSGPGLQQLAYRVSSIEEISDELRSRGVRLLYDAPRRGTADSRINFIHPKDAGGVLIELVEPSEISVH
ncbi:methylmalonyl-CoA epimerase [Rhodococcus sp. 1163]|uniref:methylmalonyl-CoA epimerase n=1 Tax=Rhodococcus sp. 1163 TaxID=1905289 RepID=UPI000A05A316|nr:methylmalonyl-CoA epimerase [Rhodococcus sp. 1163]ORI20234.1 methylmalonyl-CoA epimerase [Rhodococcus sp. 1163]